MCKFRFFPVLSLFDEGQGSGVSGGDAASTQGVKNIVYGKQDTDVSGAQGTDVGTSGDSGKGSDAGNNVAVRSDKDFDELIKGEYKDAFNRRVKSIIDRRVKGNEELSKYKADTDELMDILARKYGTKSGDTAALTKAIKEDDTFFEDAAEAEGLSVEQYKYKIHLEKENERLIRERERRMTENAAKERLAAWNEQANETAAAYPGFNLSTESENPKFVRLLQSGIDVKTAYEVVHNDEIVSGAMKVTAAAVSKQVADNIRARGQRPAENGARSQSATVFKSDVSKLTREDRAEIARRARRGEVIKF